MTDTLQRMNFKELSQQFCRQIRNRCHLLQINRNVLSASLLHRFCHYAAFAETARTDNHQMVSTIHKLLDIGYFLHSVSEILFLYNGAELERVFHTSHFFVTKIFVMQI